MQPGAPATDLSALVVAALDPPHEEPARDRIRPPFARLPDGPASAEAALIGPCTVTLCVEDRDRGAVSRAKVRGWCEDWQLPWPLKTDAVTDAQGQVVAKLPRGRWRFFVSSPAGAQAKRQAPICLVTPALPVDKDQTFLLRPDAEFRLEVSLDRRPLRGLDRLWLAHPGTVRQNGFLFELTDVSLPATVQVSRESVLRGGFVGSRDRDPRLVGEIETGAGGVVRAGFASRDLAEIATTSVPEAAFSARDVGVELCRGDTLDEPVWSTHDLWLELTPDERLLIVPGLVRIRHRFSTGDGQHLVFAPTSHQLSAGQTVTIRPGSPLAVKVFHLRNQPFMPKDVLCCAPAFTDSDGRLVQSWAHSAGRGKGRSSPVAFSVMQGDRQIATGTLPRGLRTEMAAGVQDVSLERLEYAFTLPGKDGAVTLRCTGRGQTAFGSGQVSVLAPDFLAAPAQRLADQVANLIPKYDPVVTVTPRDPQRPWTVQLWPTMRPGAMAGGAQREKIWFPVSALYNLVDDHCQSNLLVVELPHCYQFYHGNPSQSFIWQPLKAEVRRLMGLPPNQGLMGNWGARGMLEAQDGRPWPNRANLPGYILYREFGFSPFREYIRHHDVYQVWLPSLGFSEGEALCAAFSECTGQDVTPLFRAFGWDAEPERVALARRLLASAPEPLVEPVESYFSSPIHLIDGDRGGKAALPYGPRVKAQPSRFGVTFPLPFRVARVVADLSSASGQARSGANRYCLEAFDGKVWAQLPGTDTRGNGLLTIDRSIEPMAVRGIAVHILEAGAFREGGRPSFNPACYELEVFDDRGKSLTRPTVPARLKPAVAPVASEGEEDAERGDPDGDVPR